MPACATGSDQSAVSSGLFPACENSIHSWRSHPLVQLRCATSIIWSALKFTSMRKGHPRRKTSWEGDENECNTSFRVFVSHYSKYSQHSIVTASLIESAGSGSRMESDSSRSEGYRPFSLAMLHWRRIPPVLKSSAVADETTRTDARAEFRMWSLL